MTRFVMILALAGLYALGGCEESNCRRHCQEVEEYTHTVNFNTAPRLTDCDVLCAHPVAEQFNRCCDHDPCLTCEEHATDSIRLTKPDAEFREYVQTSASYDAGTDEVQLEGVLARASGSASCMPEEAVRLIHRAPRSVEDAAVFEPVSTEVITLEEFEAAKWEAVRTMGVSDQGLDFYLGFELQDYPADPMTTVVYANQGGQSLYWDLILWRCQTP